MITQRRLSETVAAKKIKIGFISLSAATQVLLKSEVTDSDKEPKYWIGNPGKLQSCFTKAGIHRSKSYWSRLCNKQEEYFSSARNYYDEKRLSELSFIH